MARFLDMGNITQQLEMKKRLNCKSFEWFMKEIAYDVLDKYPELPPNLHWGEVSGLVHRWRSQSFNHFTMSLIEFALIYLAAKLCSSPMLGHNGARTAEFNGNIPLPWLRQQPGKTKREKKPCVFL